MNEKSASGVKERLVKYLNYKGVTQKEFQDSIGASRGFVCNISKSIGLDKQRIIKEKFSDLNMGWLLYGEGEMIMTDNYSVSISGNNTTGNISQGSNNGSSNDDLYKKIIELKDRMAALRAKIYKARICPTQEEIQKRLDEILLGDLEED